MLRKLIISIICIALSVCVLATYVNAADFTVYAYDSIGYPVYNSFVIIRYPAGQADDTLSNYYQTFYVPDNSVIGITMRAFGYMSQTSGLIATAMENSCSFYLDSLSNYTGGNYTPPVDYYDSNRITSFYGWRRIGASLDNHTGLDICDYIYDNGAYDSIYSICDSNLNNYSSGWNDDMGFYAQMYSTYGHTIRYMHMSTAADLSYYSSIYKGAWIGYMGSTGNSSGTHLHIDISYINSNYEQIYLDPELLF